MPQIQSGVKKVKNRITVSLLLILFIAFYGSVTLFIHTHNINGVVIVHSHPYNPFSGKHPGDHHHSAKELIYIQLLSHFVASLLVFAIFQGLIAAPGQVFKNAEHNDLSVRLYFLTANGFRAPPHRTFLFQD